MEVRDDFRILAPELDASNHALDASPKERKKKKVASQPYTFGTKRGTPVVIKFYKGGMFVEYVGKVHPPWHEYFGLGTAKTVKIARSSNHLANLLLRILIRKILKMFMNVL